MCNLDYDPAEFYQASNRIARKSHRCDECFRQIEPKEKYKYVFAKYEGVTNTFKTCAHCLVGQNWLWEQCGGFLHGSLEEEIHEHAADYRRMDLYRFVINMRKGWENKKIPVLKD